MQPLSPRLPSGSHLPVISPEAPRAPATADRALHIPHELATSPDRCQAQLPASYTGEPTAVCFPGVVRGMLPSAQAPYTVSNPA